MHHNVFSINSIKAIIDHMIMQRKELAMPGYRIHRLWVATLVCVLTMTTAMAAETVYSTMRTVNAVHEIQGYSLATVTDYQVPSLPTDLAPPQVFEIIRPNNEQVTIGRLFTSCTCIRAETEKRIFYPGERAIVILRNIRNTPPAGQTYGLYVQITRPIRTTLLVNTFVQTGSSSPTPASAPAVVAPPPLKRGGPAVLVDNEFDQFEATGDIASADSADDGESETESAGRVDDSTVEVPGLNSPAGEDAGDAPAPSAPALGDLPKLEGIPSGDDDSTEPQIIDVEGTADIAEDAVDPELELPAGADVRDSLGGARGDLENLFDESKSSSAEIAANVDAARQAMDSYFQQGGEQAGAGAPDLAVATDIDGDIPDFYAHVPAASPVAEDADAEMRVASGLDPTLSAREDEGEAEPEELEAGAASMRPPERDPNSRKPVQAVSLITIGVRNMADSIRFYEALGWRRASPTKYDQTAFFQLQGQILALYPMKDQLREQNMPEATPSPGGITLALHVQDKADVWAVYQRFMDAGGTSLRVPAELPSGAVTSYVADPDGNPWEVSWVPQFRIDEGGGLWLP